MNSIENQNWVYTRYKFYCDIFTGATPSTKIKEYWDGEYPWINSGEIRKINIFKPTRNITELGIKNSSTRLIPKKSSVLSMVSGGIGYLEIDTYANQSVMAFVPKEINDRFLYYSLVYTDLAMGYLRSGTVQGGINVGEGKNMYFWKPQFTLQQKIANYLDQKTTKIDELIRVQEESIAKLEEFKQSLITKAVTKGLKSGNLMKYSGYQLVGEIPSNWEITKVRRLLSMAITDGPHETPKFQEAGIPFVSAEAVRNDKIDFDKIRGYISESDYLKYSEKYIPRVNDIYMVKSGSTTGKIAQVEEEVRFTIWSPLAVFRSNSLVHHRFLFYALKSDTFKSQVENKWSYGTQQNIGMRVLETLLVPYGTVDEQIEIANYLDRKTEEINQLIQIKKDKIEKLNEYKKSLIYEAVTGIIEVM